jgi:hypothetical protein
MPLKANGAVRALRLTASDANERDPHIDQRITGKQEPNGQEKGATEKEQRHGCQSQALPMVTRAK